ncbi:hypothetical protein G6011_02368 [Alternaria panax]|uniref:RING-type domain-containing protein n=1 Tax=Alternaria panax TaxID=48097 RepID=A0AAD4I4H5_9PLEO|nr:hypothetical protein G6011_02368 [Alternaria panax]
MVTKNKFIEKLQPIKCSICLDGYSSDHVPVELSCGHIFGGHCIVEQTEIRMPNNNRCPLCRRELFEQEDFALFDDTFYSNDEELIEFNDYDDSTDEDERELEEEQRRQTLAAPLVETTSASRRGRNSLYREFREHAARMRELSRVSAPKSARRTRTYEEIEEGLDLGSDESEYESEEDVESADEHEEKRMYRLLPGEYDTTLSGQPSGSQ